MRFVNFLLRRTSDPEELRRRLLAAWQARDARGLARLCRRHAALVTASFPAWRDHARELLDDEDALQSYVGMLGAVAEYFEKALGRDDLKRVLMPPDQGDPTEPWRAVLREARDRMEQLDFDGAAEKLGDFLIDIRAARGSGVRPFRAAASSLLGQCDLQRGRAADAVGSFERAAALFAEAGQPANVRLVLDSLYEAHRWLGQAAEAAEVAGRLAALHEQEGQPEIAAAWRRQEAIVRDGEPPCRVLLRLGPRHVELDEARTEPGQEMELVFKRNRPTLHAAQVRIAEGERKGAAGQLEEALADFREAAARDPYDPHSRYLAGVTLCYLARPAEALDWYREAERLAPGWFSVRAYTGLARRMARGRLEPEIFRPATALLFDAPEGAAERLEVADQLLKLHPDESFLHLGRGLSLWRLERREEAVAALRAALDHAEDEDTRTQAYLRLGLAATAPEERAALLQQAVDLNGNPLAAAMALIALRADAAQAERAAAGSAAPPAQA